MSGIAPPDESTLPFPSVDIYDNPRAVEAVSKPWKYGSVAPTPTGANMSKEVISWEGGWDSEPPDLTGED